MGDYNRRPNVEGQRAGVSRLQAIRHDSVNKTSWEQGQGHSAQHWLGSSQQELCKPQSQRVLSPSNSMRATPPTTLLDTFTEHRGALGTLTLTQAGTHNESTQTLNDSNHTGLVLWQQWTKNQQSIKISRKLKHLENTQHTYPMGQKKILRII